MAGISRNSTTKEWNSARFTVEDEAQIVTVKKTKLQYPEIFGKETTYTISVKDFGDTSKAYNCLYFFSDNADAENIPVRESSGASCNWFGSTFFFNFKNLKMQTMFRGGYMDGLDENTDTPYVAVAKCDKVG
ncbi:hypothetical protein ASE36_01890 [Rhizobium sp. Root274]|nr:hypothetical protein ASC71_01890 [Rhizobium sp. Root1240]KRD32612.1 hypothetical protein ASE36_01890 [Rhizobium sp. Root274]